MRPALWAAPLAATLLPTGSYAFEEEAIVLRQALDHVILQEIQRTIGQRIRSTVTNSPTLGLETAARPGASGMAAGDDATSRIGDVAVWANGEYLYFDDDAGGIDSDGDVWTGLGGADLVFADRFLVGVTGGFSSGETEGTYVVFDVPGVLSSSDVESDHLTVAPYAAVIFNENFYADVHVGVSFIDTDTFSSGGGFFSRGAHDSFAYYIGANANYVTVIRDFEVIAFAGVSYSDVEADEYVNEAKPLSDITLNPEDTTSNTRLSFGGQVAYPVGAVTPYVQAVAEVDVDPIERGGTEPLVGTPDPTPVEDEFGLRLTIGADATLGDAITGSIEVGTVAFREDFSEIYGTANLRFNF